MAYHTLGNGKYDALGMENKMAGHDSMTKDEKNSYINAITEAIAKISDKKIKVC